MKEVEVRLVNQDKKVIIKKVPQNLVSLYLAQGWTIVEKKEEKPRNENTSRFNLSDE